jgi:hypothetical protein
VELRVYSSTASECLCAPCLLCIGAPQPVCSKGESQAEGAPLGRRALLVRSSVTPHLSRTKLAEIDQGGA